MKILALSDTIVEIIYSQYVRQRFARVDMVISCGDLPFYYLEYVTSALNAPTFYVRGNHAHPLEYTERGAHKEPEGAFDLHCRVVAQNGVLLAGIEGSLKYNRRQYQYSQAEMWLSVWSLVPRLLYNRIRYGRFLDIFVSHAPPWGVNDQEDLPHQGIKAFLWLDKLFQPAFHLHGHIHVYRNDLQRECFIGRTKVVNVFGYREIDLPA